LVMAKRATPKQIPMIFGPGDARFPVGLGYRASQVLAFVRKCIEEEGHAPSYNMIRKELDFADCADVCKVVGRLENRGLLSRVGRGRVRRIRLPSTPTNFADEVS
jgi:SOS-response transcriptional repressor LexA